MHFPSLHQLKKLADKFMEMSVNMLIRDILEYEAGDEIRRYPYRS